MQEVAKLNIGNKVYWSSCSGRRYLTVNFSNLEDFQIFILIIYVSEIIKQEKDSSIRIITIVTNTDVGFSTHVTMKMFAKELQPYIHKSAMIGLVDFDRPFHKLYSNYTNSKAVVFNTEVEGLDYICS